MDVTLISVFGFSVIKIVLWLIVILWGISQIRKIYKVVQKDGWTYKSFKKVRFGLIMWILFCLCVVFYTNQNTAYRPKTKIKSSAEIAIEQEMRQRKGQKVVIEKTAETLTPMNKEFAEDQIKKNDESAKKSVENFMSLPE